MDTATIVGIITIIVTWILGQLSKKYNWLSSNLIPVQNIAIGVIFAIVEWIITKDFSIAIAVSGLLAGGSYDVVSNIKSIINKEEK